VLRKRRAPTAGEPGDRAAKAKYEVFAITVNGRNTIGVVSVDLERGVPVCKIDKLVWRNIMADKVKLWFDSEVDYLEVTFSDAPGYMRPTGNDGVMKRVDEQGHVIGFSVFGVSRFRKDHPLKAEFTGGE
jgi:hypothetical protein